MAAHAGTWFFDGRPARDAGGALTRGLGPMAPDGVAVAVLPGVAMAFGARHVWSGERPAVQPVVSPSGLVMTWDGRLDNRDDLLLRLRGGLRAEPDAVLALAAFEAWGIDGLHDLVGEWSAVVWDPAARVLHLARDYMGVRPLYYLVTETAVQWSTSLGELAERAGRVDDLDEAFVARFMALRFSPDVTPYRGLRAVPPATCVSVAADGAETRRRFWTVTAGRIRYRDPRDYEVHLRALWADAVGARLRADGPVWAELSGGLDSSSVVCMADALLTAGRVAATGLQTVSHVTLESPEGDERRFIAEVERKTGVKTHVIGVEESDGATDPDWSWVTPLPSCGVSWATRRLVLDNGGRLILSGRLGDTAMGCVLDNSVAVLDEVSDGRYLTAMARVRQWSRATRTPFVAVSWNLAMEAWRAARGNGVPAGFDAQPIGGVDLLCPALRARLPEPPGVEAVDAGLWLSQRRLASQIAAASRDAALAPLNELGLITYTYPFAHRPLIDFVLSIPGEQLSAPGAMRSLMRRALAGLVPARILARTSKGYYPPAAIRAARALATTMPPANDLEVVRRKWIDANALDTALGRLLDGGGTTGDEVRFVLRLEQWLRLRDRRAPAAIPRGKEVTIHAVLNT